MKVLTIGKGLVGEDGKPVTGQIISALNPEKLVYTGGVPSEEDQVRRWAKKGNREFSTSASTPKVTKKETPKESKTETKVEDVKETTTSTVVEDVNESTFTY